MSITKIVLFVISGAFLLFSSGAQAVEIAPAEANATLQTTAASKENSEQIMRGEYVVRLGDCIGCHTAPGRELLAGGQEMKTPMGSIYSTNITPDNDTGIGKYSFEQFDRAVHKGVAPDGRNLYSAMPYPSYAKTTEEDMRALYAYLIQGLAPVSRPNKPAEMSWPFSMRWGLTLWNWVFLDDTPFKPDGVRDAVWNRGAYLVQGPGHCGACHTPRGIAFQEKAISGEGSDGKFYLAGETADSWRATSLRSLRSIEDTVLLLKTGQNRFGGISGGMTPVIQYSTQYFSDNDLTAIATYLKSLPPGENDLPVVATPLHDSGSTVPASLFSTRGGLGYVQFCAGCHGQDGAGVKEVFPTLAHNPSVALSDPSTPIHITLTGWTTAQTAAYPHAYTLPSFSSLSDSELAEILSFMREGWGNKAGMIQASQIKKLREQFDYKSINSSNFQTPRQADMLAQPNAEQLIRGMRLHLETKALLPQNVGDALNCASCHLKAGTMAGASPFVGVSALFPSYATRAGRIITLEERINGCFLRSMNGKPLPVESADMQAMVAYFNWMKRETKPEDKVAGRGVGKMDMSITPNIENGKQIYSAQCAVCHGKEGEGLKDGDGRYIYPPLWGDHSFNIGAGMARTYTAAAFTKHNMPIGFHEKFPLGQGGLSDQEAVDVAEYFSHQPRPDFPGKVNDWPKDEKPKDARY